LPSELGKLSDMSTGEQHIIHIKDEEDGTPVRCVLTIEAMVLIRPKKAEQSYEIVELPIPLPWSLFQSVQALP
jgi:flagellar biosynthesis regulator FlbT